MPTFVFQIASVQRLFQAQRILTDNGHDVIVPVEYRWKRVRQRHRERVQKPRPKLGPYGFLTCEASPPVFDDLFKQRFGFHYLGEFGCPLALPEGALEKVRAMSESPKPRRKAYNSHGVFRVGEKVRITEGPFTDHVVDIKEIRGENARIVISLFNSEREVSIGLGELEAA